MTRGSLLTVCGVPLACLALLGCAAGSDYVRPATAAGAEFEIAGAAEGVLSPGPVDESWWLAFEDDTLAALIDRAIASNTDIRAATARIREARALRDSVRAGLAPPVDAGASGTRTRTSEVAGLPPVFPTYQTLSGVSLAASWEPDFFGRIRRGIEAADANFAATLEDRRNILLLVLAEVALNYADLRGAQRQHAVALRNIDLARQTLNLAELLRGQELASELDVVRARAEVTEATASLSQFLAAERTAAARLAALLGAESGELAPLLASEPSASLRAPSIPVGLAGDLLRRRADVRAAERRLAAASAAVGVEVANRYPRFSLTGSFGSDAEELADMFTAPSEAWNIAGVLQWPVFDAGRRRANVEAAEARFEAALAAYDGAVFAALGDAEAAFSSYLYAANERETLEQAVLDRQRSLELARLRFGAELDDLFPVLDAQRQLLALESRLANTERAELVAAVNVYRALGGGWAAAEERLAAPAP